jgi:hypothetical protein
VRAAVIAFSIASLVSAGYVAYTAARMTPRESTQSAGRAMPSDIASDSGENAGPGTIATRPTLLDPAQPPSRLDEVLQVLDADLGDEGSPVERREIDEALRTEPALADAILK